VLVCAKRALAKLEQLVARCSGLLELQVAGVFVSAFSSITA